MPDITEKMLTTQLREMENTGLLIRCVITEKPLNVKYVMSSKYDSLRKIISDLCDFSISYGNEHGIEIDE
jgi:DNA-binding HxlR family transcriptional regulator